MKKKMTDEQQYIYNTIDKILWEDWDPIGVNDTEEARDEYQSYTNQIFSLKIRGADIETIAKELHNLETLEMGVFLIKEHSRNIAKKIMNIKYP